jgi:hypothetical protein
MKRLICCSIVMALLIGCASSATATPTPLSLTDIPPSITTSGAPLGGGGLRVGNVAVWLFAASVPPPIGNAQLDAIVVDQNGQPLANAKVSFDIDMTNMSHGTNVTPADDAGNGHHTGTVHFLMSGPWRVIVVIERSGVDAIRARFNFEVK